MITTSHIKINVSLGSPHVCECVVRLPHIFEVYSCYTYTSKTTYSNICKQYEVTKLFCKRPNSC